jgi:exopolyphosphatase/guanosine-5'-triphosphate,3'-diphosphate pyrophosphatase
MDPAMIGACIDVGSNTTRLLVAEPVDGRLRELLRQRAFTRLGKGLSVGDRISNKKIAEVADVVATQMRLAEELGAHSIRAVGTAAIRDAGNQDQLVEAVQRASGVGIEVLTEEEEARLAFIGATRALERAPEGELAVVDVGGASSEVALGTMEGGVRWSASFRVGSGMLADAYLHSDPPGVFELERLRQHVGGVFEGFQVSTPDLGIAVGGTSTSLRRLVGGMLEHETLERALRILATTPSEEVAVKFELEAERVRLLPAGMLLLEEFSDLLGVPLLIGKGGLREGVIFEMWTADDAGS